MQLKTGDRVKVRLWNGTILGQVIKVVGRAIFVDSYDDAGVSLCVDVKAVVKVPGLDDIGYASKAGVQ